MGLIDEGRSSSVAGDVFHASGLTLGPANSDSITAGVVNAVTGATGPIDISQISNGLLACSFPNAPTGTSPTVAVFFDVEDVYGNWMLTSNATSISGALLSSTGVVYGNISTGYTLPSKGRIRWTLTGTNPQFTGVSFDLQGH